MSTLKCISIVAAILSLSSLSGCLGDFLLERSGYGRLDPATQRRLDTDARIRELETRQESYEREVNDRLFWEPRIRAGTMAPY